MREVVQEQVKNAITGWEEDLLKQKPFSEFNKVFISGRIMDEFEYSHEAYWETFYRTNVSVTRLSGKEDLIPIVVSKFLLKKVKIQGSLVGKLAEVTGQFRSRNVQDDDGCRHLELFLFVTEINIHDSENGTNANFIYLDGYVCKEPIYRGTPSGREITDLIIAANRAYKKADYIPCIAWGRFAKLASELKVGDRVELYGRIQSREYIKRNEGNSDAGTVKIAYEISVTRIKKIETGK